MRTARLLTVSQHALPGGVPAHGVYLPGCVPAREGMCLPGGYLPRYSPPLRPCEQNDRQVQK